MRSTVRAVRARSGRFVALVVALFVVAAVVAAGCVSPTPPEGEPVPALLPRVAGTGTVAGTVDVRVEVEHFVPDQVELRVDTLGGPALATDAASPFVLPLDTTVLANGAHNLFLVGRAADYTVIELLAITVDNQAYDWTAVDAAMEAKLTSVPVPGDALLVARHGGVVYEESFGTYSPTTVVPIASAAKWLSATLIMTLVDDDLVDLDEPISSYLPAFTGAKAGITLRQLLSFTSGLEEDPACTGSNAVTLQQCAGAIAALPLRATPGTQFRYGNGHLVVAGAIAEVVTGTSFASLFSQRVAQPLGMASTIFVGGANPNPAGGAWSNLADYSRFLRAMWDFGELDGVRVLSRAAVEEMQQDQTGGAPIVVASAIRKALGSRYGFGEWFDVFDPVTGTYEVSSPGARGFHPWIDRERDVYGVYVVFAPADSSSGGGWDVKTAVRNAVDAAT